MNPSDSATLNSQYLRNRGKELSDSKNQSGSSPSKTNALVGTFEQTQSFLQGNIFLKTGYRINQTSFKQLLLSVFKMHNETLNIWIHLIASILAISFIILGIWYFDEANKAVKNLFNWINEGSEFNSRYSEMVFSELTPLYNSIS